jgi:lipoyl(octanoyl) transferase
MCLIVSFSLSRSLSIPLGFVRTQVVITALAHCGIPNATRLDKFTGVWVGDAKLAAIGLSVSKWVTMHGFAVNVNPDLGAFERIVPCGISITEDNKTVSSLAHQAPALWSSELDGRRCEGEDMERVESIVMQCFGDVFDVDLEIHNRAPTERELDA